MGLNRHCQTKQPGSSVMPTVTVAASYTRRLVESRARETGASVKDAARDVAAHLRQPYGSIWGLLFRAPKTVSAELLVALQEAVERQVRREINALTKGLPDLLIIGGRVRIAFMELKVATGRLSLEQKLFRNLCAFVGIEFVDAYGRDEPIAALERWGIVRPNLNGPVR
ncbi:hypothetical protein E8E01_15060 [Methylorubrum populi]|uniref:hypothetical protein n=1 Tax=Methylorubrum populi TaxID=223967 RepID=UPI001151F783|nr:hypothetical protein [Methylorubrum populi]QDI81670.1 hypothetical protein E8E01_15060 [Methylorubrum populi]